MIRFIITVGVSIALMNWIGGVLGFFAGVSLFLIIAEMAEST